MLGSAVAPLVLALIVAAGNTPGQSRDTYDFVIAGGVSSPLSSFPSPGAVVRRYGWYLTGSPFDREPCIQCPRHRGGSTTRCYQPPRGNSRCRLLPGRYAVPPPAYHSHLPVHGKAPILTGTSPRLNSQPSMVALFSTPAANAPAAPR